MQAEQRFQIDCRAVAPPDPDDVRWRAEANGEVVEVGILRYKGEAPLGCFVPHDDVVSLRESGIGDVLGLREHVAEPAGQVLGEVVVEQEHGPDGGSGQHDTGPAC